MNKQVLVAVSFAITFGFAGKAISMDATQPPLNPVTQPYLPPVKSPASAQKLINNIRNTRPPIRRSQNLSNVESSTSKTQSNISPVGAIVGGGDSGGPRTNGPSLTGSNIKE